MRRERARLARRVGALAKSLERMRVDARRPMRNRPVVAPLYFPSVIREVDAELARTARLLRDGTPDLAAVARTEELLGGESSPLYGPDVLRLREELPGCSTRSAPASPASLRRSMTRLVPCLVVVLALVAAGCGGDSEADDVAKAYNAFAHDVVMSNFDGACRLMTKDARSDVVGAGRR